MLFGIKPEHRPVRLPFPQTRQSRTRPEQKKRLHKNIKASAVQMDTYRLLQLYEWAQPEAWTLSHKPSAECCLRYDPTPTPHHIQPRDLATSSGMKHGAQIFCLAERLSSLAGGWDTIELSTQGVLRSVPTNTREEGCPGVRSAKPAEL